MGTPIDIQATEVFDWIWEAVTSGKYRYIILEGGSRSSKTTSLIQAYYLLARKHESRMTVWRAKRTWCKASVHSDWIKYLKVIEQFRERDNNMTDLSTKIGKSIVEFNGLDDYQKLHGLTQDYSWLNEGMESKREDFDQLDMRTNKLMFIDYNPTEEQHWIYEVAKLPEAILITSTMLNNPFLPEAIRRKILGYEVTPANIKRGTADLYMWEVYGLGKRRKREGLIFTYEMVKEWDNDAKMLGYGLDFGFSPDPTALVGVGLLNGRLILDELLYETELQYVSVRDGDDSMEKRMKELGVRGDIVSDSAGKSGIRELQQSGINIVPVRKYPGSVVDGIKLMKGYAPFYITERSMNLKKELDNYAWKKDNKTGKAGDEPIDDFNHLIDATRYVVQTKKTVKFSGVGVA